MFVQEQVSEEEINYFYSYQDENKSADEAGVYLNEENLANLNYYYKLRDLIKARVSGGNLLDVGCSAGYFLDVMTDYEVYGIELSPIYSKLAKEKYGDHIFEGSFEHYNPPEGVLFDCIALQDVLDHMRDPMAALKKCYSLLKPGGIIIVKVHDSSCLFAKLSGKNFYAIIPPEHLSYFSRSSLRMALEKNSFHNLDVHHFGHVIFFSTIFQRLSQGIQGSKMFKLFEALEGTKIGKIKIYKNLKDVITVIAEK